MVLQLLARPAPEIRQLGQRDVHAEGAGAGLEAREAPMEIGVDGALGHEVAEQQLRGHVGRHRARGDALAGGEANAARPAAFDDQRGDRRLGADDGTARLRGPRHRLADGAHAADRVAPHARLAVDLAEAVMQQHVGRAGRERAGIGTDDAVEGERALHDLALEPLREKIGRALGEEVEQQALVGERQAEEPPPEARAADQLDDAAAGVGRPPQGQLAQERCGALQGGVVGRQPLRVLAENAAMARCRPASP